MSLALAPLQPCPRPSRPAPPRNCINYRFIVNIGARRQPGLIVDARNSIRISNSVDRRRIHIKIEHSLLPLAGAVNSLEGVLQLLNVTRQYGNWNVGPQSGADRLTECLTNKTVPRIFTRDLYIPVIVSLLPQRQPNRQTKYAQITRCFTSSATGPIGMARMSSWSDPPQHSMVRL